MMQSGTTTFAPLAGGDDDDDDGPRLLPTTTASSGARLRRRNDSVLVRNIEEKKEVLYTRQAGDYAAWIERFLNRPPSETDLLTSLRSGYVLCAIARTIDPSVIGRLEGLYKYPLKEARMTNLFQSIENIRCFLAACKLIGVKDVDLFEPDDLMEGLNKLKVLRTLQVLRKMVDTGYVEVEYEQYGTASFDVNFLSATGKPKQKTADGIEVHPLDRSLLSKMERVDEPAPAPARKDAARPRQQQIKSMYVLGDSRSDDGLHRYTMYAEESEPFPEPEPAPAPSQPAPQPPPAVQQPPPQQPPVEEQPPPPAAEPPAETAPAAEEAAADRAPRTPRTPLLKVTIAEPDASTVASAPSLPSLPSTESLMSPTQSEADLADGRHEPFLEDNVSDELVSRLLSKTTSMMILSEEEDEDESDDDEMWSHLRYTESDSLHTSSAPPANTEVIIRSLRAEVDELQEILKTEVVAHVKDQERTAEFIHDLEKKIEDAEVRAEQNERLWKSSEQRIRELESRLIQMQHENLTLKSTVDEAREAAAAAEAARLAAEAEAHRQAMEAEAKARKAAAAAAAAALAAAAATPNGTGSAPAPPAASAAPLQASEPAPPAARPVSAVLDDDTAPILLKADTQLLWRHQPGVSGVLSTLSEKEQARQEVIFELLATEEAYAADLDLVIRLFLNPMSAMIDDRTFKRPQLQAIFANIQVLFKVNTAFFADLKARQKEQWPTVRMICDIFLKHVKAFQVYADYCGNQKRAMRELGNAKASSALVRSHLEMCEGYKECRKLGLATFLLLPMQRITKYPLLIKNLMRVTDARHPDYYNANTALNELTKIIDVVNQYAKVGDDLERVYELEEQLDWGKLGKSLSLVNPATDAQGRERYLVREGNLGRIRLKSKSLTRDKAGAKKPDQLHVILLSDMLLFCRSQPSVASEVASPRRSMAMLRGSSGPGVSLAVQVDPLLYDDFRVRNVPDGNNGIGADNIFLVSGKAIGTILLQADSTQEKRAWISDFRRMGLLAETMSALQPSDAGERRTPTTESSGAVVPATAAAAESAGDSAQARTSTTVPRAQSGTTLGRPIGRVGQSRFHTRSSSDVSPDTIAPLATSPPQQRRAEDTHAKPLPSTGRFVEPPVPNMTLSQLKEPEFDGWLKLKTVGMAHWKLRWFVLKDFCLYYFAADKPEAKAMGMVMMPSYQVAELKNTKKNYVFQVVHPSTIAKPYLLQADTREYMDVWIEALTHAAMAQVARRNFWL